jgi:hypothetical protein
MALNISGMPFSIPTSAHRTVSQGPEIGANILQLAVDIAAEEFESQLSREVSKHCDVGCSDVRAFRPFGDDQMKWQEDAGLLVGQHGLVGLKGTPDKEHGISVPSETHVLLEFPVERNFGQDSETGAGERLAEQHEASRERQSDCCRNCE